MRILGLLLFIICFSNFAFSFPSPWPNKEVYDSYIDLSADVDTLKVADSVTDEGLINAKHARFVYNYTDTATPTYIYDSGIDLPAKSVIVKAHGLIVSPIVSVNDNTLKLDCGSIPLYQAVDLTDTASGSLIRNFVEASTTSSASASYVTSACDLKVTVGSGASGVTSGKIVWDVEYFVAE